MQFAFPRVIIGNWGDLASRWGILRGLDTLGNQSVSVFCANPDEIPPFITRHHPYGPGKNLLAGLGAWQILKDARRILWAAGLDLQDDSSKTKLCYLWLLFAQYRVLGLPVTCLFQGAGPLETGFGRAAAREVLRLVDQFVARDPGSFNLVGDINQDPERYLGHDGIFMPGMEKDVIWPGAIDPIRRLFDLKNRPIVGFNVRQWFHFGSDLLPYQFSRKRYLERSSQEMARLINSAVQTIRLLREEFAARVVLISAYRRASVPWENDLPWLDKIKERLSHDAEVIVLRESLPIGAYFGVMASFDLVIGMRLHSTLTSLRFGVPAVNISYTLKGEDIMHFLGLPEYVIDIQDWLHSPWQVLSQAGSILEDLEKSKAKVRETSERAIAENRSLLSNLLENWVSNST